MSLSQNSFSKYCPPSPSPCTPSSHLILFMLILVPDSPKLLNLSKPFSLCPRANRIYSSFERERQTDRPIGTESPPTGSFHNACHSWDRNRKLEAWNPSQVLHVDRRNPITHATATLRVQLRSRSWDLYPANLSQLLETPSLFLYVRKNDN